MERAVEEARARKLGSVGLSVAAENVVARKLYEEMGFEATRLKHVQTSLGGRAVFRPIPFARALSGSCPKYASIPRAPSELRSRTPTNYVGLLPAGVDGFVLGSAYPRIRIAYVSFATLFSTFGTRLKRLIDGGRFYKSWIGISSSPSRRRGRRG